MLANKLTMQPGHDGQPPIFPEVRDLDGKGKRSIAGITNVNTDRLGYLHAHGRITEAQRDAGRRLQADAQLAQIGGYATATGEPAGGNGYRGLSDTKLDAQRRHASALACLGGDGARIVDLVAISGHSLAKAEAIMRLPVGGGIGALRVALGVLAAHYGIS